MLINFLAGLYIFFGVQNKRALDEDLAKGRNLAESGWKKSQELLKTQKIVNIPTKAPVIAEKIPEKEKQKPFISTYFIGDKQYTSINAAVKEIIMPGQDLKVILDNGKEAELKITSQTRIFKAKFELDGNGNVRQTLYEEGKAEDLAALKTGQKIRVSYMESDFSTHNPVLITEIGILE